MKYYAGIGSRKTPNNILELMRSIAIKLETDGYFLRSGGATGADTAFECDIKNKEIFYAQDATDSAIQIASNFHPAWDKCSPFVKKLHGRNAMILLGDDLTKPVNFVICYTEDGKDSGGTGLGIRISNHYKIPVFNLYEESVKSRLIHYLNDTDIL